MTFGHVGRNLKAGKTLNHKTTMTHQTTDQDKPLQVRLSDSSMPLPYIGDTPQGTVMIYPNPYRQ